MRKFALITMIFISASILTYGQRNIFVEKIRTEEKIFSGKIDDKYEITIYLKFFHPSVGHEFIYSVKGWYYYNSVKKHIPLVGIYDGSLTLYVFKSQQKQDTVLSFLKNGLNFWENIEYLKNLSGFDEKFNCKKTDNENLSEWLFGNKKLKLTLDNSDYSILEKTELLQINSQQRTETIKFSDIGIYDEDLKVINFIEEKEEKRVLLEFKYNSRPYALGMCGAGFEAGFIILRYDSQYNLIDIQRVLTESCLDGIFSEEAKENNNDLKKYKITDRDFKISALTLKIKEIEMNIEK